MPQRTDAKKKKEERTEGSATQDSFDHDGGPRLDGTRWNYGSRSCEPDAFTSRGSLLILGRSSKQVDPLPLPLAVSSLGGSSHGSYILYYPASHLVLFSGPLFSSSA